MMKSFLVLCGRSGVGKSAVRAELAPRLGAASLGPDDFGGNWSAVYDALDVARAAVVECCKLPTVLVRKMERRGGKVVLLTLEDAELRARMRARGDSAATVAKRMGESTRITYDEIELSPDLTIAATPTPREIATRIVLWLGVGGLPRIPTTTERGYGWRWQKARGAFLSSNPLCAMCEETGRITPASVVDHIVPHKGNQQLFWDTANWQALCAPCHNGAKQVLEARGFARGCNENGVPYGRSW